MVNSAAIYFILHPKQIKMMSSAWALAAWTGYHINIINQWHHNGNCPCECWTIHNESITCRLPCTTEAGNMYPYEYTCHRLVLSIMYYVLDDFLWVTTVQYTMRILHRCPTFDTYGVRKTFGYKWMREYKAECTRTVWFWIKSGWQPCQGQWKDSCRDNQKLSFHSDNNLN